MVAPAVTILILLCCFFETGYAQVQVSPTRVMLGMHDCSEQVNVLNSTFETVEITVGLDFRLIRSDSNGRISISATVNDVERERSCAEWLKIFPRRFSLAPGESRSVRILAIPPASIEGGEYWGRLIVGSVPVSLRPAAADVSQAIETKLTMRIELDIPIVFRKGNVETGIEFQAISASTNSVGTVVLVDLHRLGNSAYRGTLNAMLSAADGTEIIRLGEQFTAEFGLRKALRFPVLSAGRYSLKLESVTVKKAGANDAVINAPTVWRVYDFDVATSGIQISSR